MAIPLHIRVPLEYAFSLGFALAIAWLYSMVAKADLWLALGVGLTLTVAVYVGILLFMAKKARKGLVHPITIALLGITAAYALGLIG